MKKIVIALVATILTCCINLPAVEQPQSQQQQRFCAGKRLVECD